MATSNVEYYEKQQCLQDSQHTCEQERMVLEQKLNSYSKSDARFCRLRAAKLQAYWKKLCEDEKKSRSRNEQVLKEFSRVENHMKALHTKTEKCAIMKRQYEEYIERMYPHWKEKVQQWEARKQRAQEEQRHGATKTNGPSRQSFTERFMAQKSPQVQFELHGQTGGYSSQSPYPHTQTQSVVDTKDNTMNKVQHFDQQPEPKFATPDSTTQNESAFGSLSQVTDLPLSTPRQTGLQNGEVDHGVEVPRRSGSLEKQSSRPHPVLIPTLGRLGGTGSSQGSDILASERTGTLSEQVTGVSDPGVSARSVEVSARDSVHSARSGSVISQRSEGIVSPRSDGLVSPDQTHSLGEDAQSASFRSTGSSLGRRSLDRQGRFDHEEEVNFDSDQSLPLSIGVEVQPQLQESGKSDVPTPRILIPDTPRDETPALARLGLSQEGSLPTAESSLKAELKLGALYTLLKFVQDEFADTFCPETFYRSHPPTLAARKDIIYNSNHNDNLDHHDPGVVSMVILDELPLLGMSLPGECLLSDDIIKTTSAFTKEPEIRSQLKGDAAVLWSKLFEHLTLAVHHNIMSAHEMAEEFAPLIVSKKALSSTVDRTTELLEHFLQSATTLPAGSTMSDVSSPPMSPVRDITSPLRKASSPPPLGSIDEDDDFFSIKPPQEDLTQTAAYRNLLTGTMTKTASINDDDSEDDIENQLALSPQQSLEKQGSAAGVGIGSGSVSAGMSKAASKDDDDSIVSSLSGAGPVYVPTAMDKSGTARSTGSFGLGSSGQKKMSAAFRTGSDIETDTEIELPSSAGGRAGAKSQVSDDKDDFDFYD